MTLKRHFATAFYQLSFKYIIELSIDETTDYRFMKGMKVVSSIKTLKDRHPDCKVVRRRGRLYVINKTNPRFKARQG